MPETGAIARKPKNMTFENAASLVFGGHTAAVFLKDRVKIDHGDEVLINGASGAVGTAAVQIAKHFGAVVTAVCSDRNSELVRLLGADHVIDYSDEDFTRNGKTYNVVVDCVGNAPFERVQASIKAGGTFMPVVGDLKGMLRAPIDRWRSGKVITASDVKPSAEALEFVVKLAEAGEFQPVTDRTYAFHEIVEAHRYVDTGRKRGNVVVRVAPPASA